jgi:hypothetical protein
MKKLKSYEIITMNGKSHYVSAISKKSVLEFWSNSKPKTVKLRKDIEPSENFTIPQ